MVSHGTIISTIEARRLGKCGKLRRRRPPVLIAGVPRRLSGARRGTFAEATFFGEAATAKAHEEAMPPISVPERLGAYLLLASTIVLGLYPRLLMDMILPGLNGPLFEQLRQGGWR